MSYSFSQKLELERRALDMRAKGATYQAISDALGIALSTAFEICKQRGAEDKKKDERVWRKLEHLLVLDAQPTRRKGISRLYLSCLSDVTSCAYCGKNGTSNLGPDKRPWTADHIIPLRYGGLEIKSNVVKACWSCNTKKHSRAWKPLEGSILADLSVFNEDTYDIDANINVKPSPETLLDQVISRLEALEKQLNDHLASCTCNKHQGA